MHVQESDGLVEWVRGGGGLVYGGHAWSWVEQNPGKNVYTDFTGGKHCAQHIGMGPVFTICLACNNVWTDT